MGFFKDSPHFLYDVLTKVLTWISDGHNRMLTPSYLKIFDVGLCLKLKFDFFGPSGSSHFGCITTADHTTSRTSSLNRCESGSLLHWLEVYRDLAQSLQQNAEIFLTVPRLTRLYASLWYWMPKIYLRLVKVGFMVYKVSLGYVLRVSQFSTVSIISAMLHIHTLFIYHLRYAVWETDNLIKWRNYVFQFYNKTN